MADPNFSLYLRVATHVRTLKSERMTSNIVAQKRRGLTEHKYRVSRRIPAKTGYTVIIMRQGHFLHGPKTGYFIAA
jgi:hypothetical protein